MESPRIPIPYAALADFCRRHHIRRLALFGSVLREDFGPESDVDVLVEFEPGHTPGLAFIDVQDGLSTLFGRPVDLLTFRSVEQSENYLFRRDALSRVQTLYDAAA
ncbi:MAG TPA: nucleotidyltransferase family protein [Longimicrobiales bacterium]|nr:nucleotidyltransferase family protein [Longimicrobiales bacterium]